jgi:hypothetical protein
MVIDPAKPGLLPVDPAGGLTAVVAGTVAAEVFEVDGVIHPPAPRGVDRVADLVHSSADRVAAAHVGQKLRHEGQAVQRAIAVKRGQDLSRGTNLDHVARTQGPLVGRSHGTHGYLLFKCLDSEPLTTQARHREWPSLTTELSSTYLLG